MTTPPSLPLIDPDPNHQQITSVAAIGPILSELERRPIPEQWAKVAEIDLRSASDELVARVGVKAVKVARKADATYVDRPHVAVALENLASANVQTLCYTLFGLFGGGGIGVFTTVLSTKPPQLAVWLIAGGAFMLIAIILLAVGWAKKPIQT